MGGRTIGPVKPPLWCPRRPGGELVAQALRQCAVWVEPHDVTHVGVDVAVVLRPRMLACLTAQRDAVHLVDHALRRFDGRCGVRVLGGEILDLLEQRHELMCVSQQDGVELGKPGGGGFEQRLRLIYGVEPVVLQQLGDL